MAALLLLASLVGSALAVPVDMNLLPRAASYPEGWQTPPQSMTPQPWLDALQAAVSSGKIPNVPVATADSQGNIDYPNNAANDPATCSWTVTKCNGPGDIYEAPNNTIAVAFDDGPTEYSNQLYDFLQQQNQPATHFMIGSNVVENEGNFMQAVALGNQHFSVHTWSHPLMTTKTNEQVVAELGWTMQVIYDKSGYIPATWRPPQGDVDARVRAIAKEVFGLTTVMWNDDPNDWCLDADGSSECPGEVPGENYDSVAGAVQGFIHGAHTPGIIILEHELSPQSIGIFKNYFPTLPSLGLTPKCIPDLFGLNWYANAAKPGSPKTSQTQMLASAAQTPAPASDSSSSSSAPSSASSSSASSSAHASATSISTSGGAAKLASHSTSSASMPAASANTPHNGALTTLPCFTVLASAVLGLALLLA